MVPTYSALWHSCRRGYLSYDRNILDLYFSNGIVLPRHLEDRHGRTRTPLALQAGIRRAGLRTLPGRRHQPRPRRHVRGRPQHHRQLAAETARVRPVGETRPRARRRRCGARPLFALCRLQLRDHPGRVQSGRAGGSAADGAQAARRQGRHLLAAQPPAPPVGRFEIGPRRRADRLGFRRPAAARSIARAGPGRTRLPLWCRRGRRCAHGCAPGHAG